ncbi:uncharacterized protein LOC129776101 [Toxorhynchites rutilus septentrionalis]|uniref:uncharacterized protein LOC129776101 n=1 Tax=Toxorhynchites rutilus septentrionalis TaxID=329112 RepID=UPI002479681A|nr:uncharacterized protein LOC129776101 [Toxorhynchites rutilus septentrionalis]
MTSSRRRRLAAITTYEQRRRRLRGMGEYLPSAQTATTQQRRSHVPLLWRDKNNNDLPPLQNESTAKRYFVGAIIYKRPAVHGPDNRSKESDEFALHVFEQHKVQVRHDEPESRILNRIFNEYSAIANGKSTFISSIYLMQKYVPTDYSNGTLFELNGSIGNPVKQIHHVNLRFQRKYVPVLMHEYDPSTEADGRETYIHLSSVSLNV